MFEKLIRRVSESASKARVGFLSEPTAIVGGDQRDRKVIVASLEEWYAIDKENGDDAASASIQRDDKDNVYAVVVSASNPAVVLVKLDKGEARAEFLDKFLNETRAPRVILGNNLDLRAARINPPPPPPPPNHEFWKHIVSLDAFVKVSRLEVLERDFIVDPNFRNPIER